jgi:two-component system phosphate regulon response regulator OmpR
VSQPLREATTTSQPHILVVDDDERLLDLLHRYLRDHGFRVTTAADAAEARQRLNGLTFDLLIVDVMLPGENGLELTNELRRNGGVPILLLTARGDPEDRIAGLESGADDYLAKPFEPRELVLRIGNILRRVPVPPLPPAIVRFGGFRFSLADNVLRQGDAVVSLNATEALLLRELATQVGEAVSREQLSERTGAGGNLRTVDVQITRLRRKIEPDPRDPMFVLTVRGQGYALRAEREAS